MLRVSCASFTTPLTLVQPVPAPQVHLRACEDVTSIDATSPVVSESIQAESSEGGGSPNDDAVDTCEVYQRNTTTKQVEFDVSDEYVALTP